MSLLGQTEAVVDHLQPLTAGKEAGPQSMAVFNRGVGFKKVFPIGVNHHKDMRLTSM